MYILPAFDTCGTFGTCGTLFLSCPLLGPLFLMKLVVVIPTFNEKDNIGRLLHRVSGVLQGVRGWTWNILVVDDSSPDGTAEVVRERARRSRRIHLIEGRKKTGLGAAYLAGMREAFGKFNADVVVTMDADLSHDPKYLAEFLKKIEEGFDFVVGSRYISGGSVAKGWAPHRKLLSVLGNKIVAFLLERTELTDWTSGYRAIDKKVFKYVAPGISDFRGYTFNISFAYYAVVSGANVSEVPIRFIDRRSGESKLGFEYLLHTPFFLLGIRFGKRFKV